MSQTITISNFDSPNIKQTAKLNADAVVGATSLSVNFTDNLTLNDYLYIGRIGTESGEVKQITAITNANTLTCVATVKPHYRFDDTTTLFGNQLQIYRASNIDGRQPPDASFSVYGSPIAINFDTTETAYTDPTGDSTFWYKYTYVNALTSAATALAGSSAVRGGDIGNYTSIEAIRREAGLMNNHFVTNAMIDSKRQAAQAYINATLAVTYIVPFLAPVNPLIVDITKSLAAGYLLVDNYGPTSSLNTNQGQQKIDYVIGTANMPGILDRINTKEIILVDAIGVAQNNAAATIFNAWPDNTTATADTSVGGGPRLFRSLDRY